MFRQLASPISLARARWPLVGGALLAACSAPKPALQPPPPVSPFTAIVGATVWDGTGRDAIPRAVVLVRDRHIVCAGDSASCPVPGGARRLDGRGRWLIPGLIDSHVHLLFLTGGSAGPQLAADLRDLLAQGITTVRDMGTNPAELIARARALPATPRVYAMQLVAGPRFFFNSPDVSRGRRAAYRQPPALTMQRMGWTPIMFDRAANPDSVVAIAKRQGAIGLKLYAYLDAESVRRLADAAHRAGMPVWGHAWVQPASVMDQVLAGQDGIVHAAGLAGELFSAATRDTLVHDGDLQIATADAATVAAADDPRILAALDTMARRGTMFEPTLDAVAHSVALFNRRERQVASIQAMYARAAAGFGMEITREAVRRGIRISAGSDHVAYGPRGDRATLLGELRLLVDSVGLLPADALLAATRDAARAIGEPVAHEVGAIAPGRKADLVLLRKNPLERIENLETVDWIMADGRLWRPSQLRSGVPTSDW